jgi:hypothetical protein
MVKNNKKSKTYSSEEPSLADELRVKELLRTMPIPELASYHNDRRNWKHLYWFTWDSRPAF